MERYIGTFHCYGVSRLLCPSPDPPFFLWSYLRLYNTTSHPPTRSPKALGLIPQETFSPGQIVASLRRVGPYILLPRYSAIIPTCAVSCTPDVPGEFLWHSWHSWHQCVLGVCYACSKM